MRNALTGSTARGARNGFRGVKTLARGVSIPSPSMGWDAISPLASMEPAYAVALDNLFPQPGYVEVRKGHKLHNQITGVTAPVETLMAYNGLTVGADKLFAAANGSVYDVTTDASSAAVVSGLSNARLQHINFSTSGGNYLWFCNGAAAPRMWDGSTWATPAITGVSATSIVNVAAYSERIWMCALGDISPYYLPSDSIQGAATKFDLSGVFSRGGFLQAIAAWSRDGGQGPDDNIAFITSRGEVAIYSGDPQRNMEIAGVYSMGSPLGRRCASSSGTDVAVLCVDGVVPLSRAISTDRAAILNSTITARIQPVMNQSARDYGSAFGWQFLSYPRGTRAILNVPVVENQTQVQYVMNTVTGAWCRFLGEGGNCWELFKDRLFYGGNAGQTIEADCQGFDHDGGISFEMETAFNYCGTRGRLKDFTMARAALVTDGKASLGMSMNIDFARGTAVNALTIAAGPVSLWGSAIWGLSLWSSGARSVLDWTSQAGEGYCAGVRMTGGLTADALTSPSSPAVLQINGFDVLVMDGGFV
jgi:hypothetical protein